MWLHKSGEPPGDPNHQIGYDHDVIDICPACDGATLEHLRHDCFDFEAVWDQYEWYEFSPDDGARLRSLASRCDRPLEPLCNCATHKSLRESLRALPSSSWDAVFESPAHRHLVTVSDGRRPVLSLVSSGVAAAAPAGKSAASGAAKPADARAVVLVIFAWPTLLVAALFSWFQWVNVPWWADALAVIAAVPVSFVVAGIVLAAANVLFSRKRRAND